MTDLMTHVESIVRPVRANERRKLRMRRELLAHLDAALDEERALHPGGDPATALARAKARLGNPSILTRQLQDSVPAFERVLRSDAPAFGPLQALERRAQRFWSGTPFHSFDRRYIALPLAHELLIAAASSSLPILVVLAAAAPSVLRLHNAPSAATVTATHSDRPFFVGALFCMSTFIWLAAEFILEVARPASAGPRRSRRLFTLAFAATTLQPLTTLLIHLGLTGRPTSAADLVPGLAATLVLLIILASVGRLVASLRRPYDPWLTLSPAA